MGEWKKIKLKEVLKEINERNKEENITNVLSVTNSRGFIEQSEYFEGTVHSENISNYKIVKKNQFAYNPSRVDVGSIDLLEKYEEGVLSPMYVIFETDNSQLLPEYFKYYFQTHRFLENVKNNTQGSVRKSLNFEALSNFEYLLPPIEEQKKILQMLKKIDLIINKTEYKSKEIEYQKQNYVKTLLSKENLKEVKWVKLKDITTLITKGTTAKKFVNDGIKFIKIEALNGKNIINDKCSYVTKEEHEGFLKRSILEDNDILFGIAGSIGKCAIVEKHNLPANTNQALAIIRLKDKEKCQYILKILQSNIMKRYIEMNLTAGAQPNLNLEQVGNFKIPILDENNVNIFLKIIDLYERQLEALNNKKQQFELMKKGLMQKLLTGKVKI